MRRKEFFYELKIYPIRENILGMSEKKELI
jgi:hypothetical protein